MSCASLPCSPVCLYGSLRFQAVLFLNLLAKLSARYRFHFSRVCILQSRRLSTTGASNSSFLRATCIPADMYTSLRNLVQLLGCLSVIKPVSNFPDRVECEAKTRLITGQQLEQHSALDRAVLETRDISTNHHRRLRRR